jgi:hypothetical protein
VSTEPEPELSDLDWLAFRYVAGEATDDEALALEERLVGDQAAREAVGRAAALGVRLASGGQAIVEPRRAEAFPALGYRVAHAAAWTAFGAAATLAIMLSTARFRPAPAAPPAASPSTQAVNALAWLQVRDIGDTTDRVEREFESQVDETSPIDDADGGAAVPSWVVDIANPKPAKGKP